MVKEKMNRKTQVQAPAPEETPPSSPAASISSITPVNRADVERRFQQFFTTEQFESDLFWDQMVVDAGRYWLLYPLREQMQALAREHFNKPDIFYRESLAVYKRHLSRLVKTRSGRKNIAWYNHFRQRVDNDLAASIPTPDQGKAKSRPPVLPRLPDGISAKQLVALDCLLPILRAPYTGLPLTETPPKKVIAALKALTARTPGALRKEIYDKAYELKKSGKGANEICKILNLYSPNSPAHDRNAIRHDVLSACQYRKKTASGVRKYRS